MTGASMHDTDSLERSTRIAVIGMSCRFPGARDYREFWRNLRAGVESITFLTEADLRAQGQDPALLQRPDYVNAAPILEDADLFDAGFFGFSARDAEILDPQQRIFLECAWHALEDAGYVPETFNGPIGVYAGVDFSKYLFNLLHNPQIVESMGAFQISLGNDKDHLTTRVAYKLNLKGPAVTVQTTCSTSLVAVCMACQSLIDYQCDMALAGGTALNVPQKTGYRYQEGGISSPDGHCRPFDARAKGTLSGSGVGIVVLKRLEDALTDGDQIRAVIHGFATNNDGALKVGYTAPSVEGQAEVIAMAQAMAGFDPQTIGYIEAHGTATPLGDPIEVAALTKVFRGATQRKQFCALGSVKSNFGHANSAAGVAGLIKTVLALEHGMIPPSLHFSTPNPDIDFAGSPFYVSDRLHAWEVNGVSRRAGVSSFGIGGTNAHVVLEEAARQEDRSASRPWQLLTLSARTQSGLGAARSNLLGWLTEAQHHDLADVAYTLNVGRQAFDHRYAVLCRHGDCADAALAIGTTGKARTATGVRGKRAPWIAFLFPGQGAQYPGMGCELYAHEPDFREEVDRCCETLRPALGRDLRQLVFSTPQDASAEQQLSQTELAQPALFVIEYALARLWRKWGVEPAALAGHSIGEYTAACLAGVFSLEDALLLVAERGRLMQSMPSGAMLAVLWPEHKVAPALLGALSVAAVNGPNVCVVAGPHEDVQRLEQTLTAAGAATRRLHTSHAFHSSMMEPVVVPLRDRLKRIELRRPQLPLLSNVTGTWITAELATDPDYWARHLLGTVRFGANLAELFKQDGAILLEVGPGQTLSGLASQDADKPAKLAALTSLSAAKDRGAELQNMHESLAQLWVAGASVDWGGYYAHQRRRRVPSPTYPFERQRYWVEAQPAAATVSATTARAAVRASRKLPDLSQWLHQPTWSAAPLSVGGGGASSQTWLVLADDAGVGAGLSDRLSRFGQRVVSVRRGDRFAGLDGEGISLRADRPEDYDALVRHLSAIDAMPDRIVHAFGCARVAESMSSWERFGRAQDAGFYSVLYLVQALRRVERKGPVEVGVFGTEMVAVQDFDPLDPAKAPVCGLAKVIGQEMPGVRCRLIDVGLHDMLSIDALCDSLVAELDSEPFEPVVAVRRGGRWVQRYAPLPLSADVAYNSVVRRGGVYLITGGLGQIGLLMARFFAYVAQARLVLVGRTSLPPRAQWGAILESGPLEPAARKIRELLEIEKLGGQVEVVSADVANTDELRDVLRQVHAKFGTLHGVVHGAGYTTAGALRSVEDTDRPHCESHFRPKVAGLSVLHELLDGQPLDFVLLHSSLSTVLGGIGFAAYAAANCYLDAFAALRNRTGATPWISVNWDGWQFPSDDELADAQRLAAIESILPQEGIELFRRILSAAPRRVVAATYDLQQRIAQWTMFAGVRGDVGTASQAEPPGRGATQHARPALSTEYAAPATVLERSMAELWQELLGIGPVGINDNFFELGGHSLLAIQLVSRMRDRLKVELAVNKVFESPSVAQLAALLNQLTGSDEKAPAAEPALVPVARDRLRVTLSSDGSIEVPAALREKLS